MDTNTKRIIPTELYLEASGVFHWATKRHFVLWFTGSEDKRHRRTETVLRRLSVRKKLRTFMYGKKLVYCLPRKSKGFDDVSGLAKVVHGLACTECLVRFYRSRTDGVVVAEKFFYGLGSVPEWGIIYPNGRMLLLEFCTKSNFYFSGNIKGKLSAYRNNLPRIEEKFGAKCVVVFVCDVDRSALESQAGSVADGVPSASYDGDTFPEPFYFVDYKTFLSIPIGGALKAPVYIWSDGKEYSLA